MDHKTLEKLEFGQIIAQLGQRCATSLGHRRAERLRPSSDEQWVRRRLAETTQARKMIEQRGRPPFGGITDVGNLFLRASRGGVLDTSEFLRVADALRGFRLLQDYIRKAGQGFPLITALGNHVHSFPDIEERIAEVITPEGEVRDSASQELQQLRRRSRRLREDIQQAMNRFVNRPEVQRYLQDRLVTVRRDRPCVPVKAEFKGAVPGIVHDASSSGATTFIEPVEVIEPGNELEATLAAERHEIERILRELSAELGAQAEALRETLTAASILDFVFAKASYSLDLDCIEPDMAPDGGLVLVKARHPLIPKGQVVPIDLWVGEDFDVLLITGPNTGGKTVSLKTAGLLCAMAQAGLHIPADEGSRLPVLRNVYADIGDEQSIQQSLSTFSSHMSNISRILRRAASGSLVLLDELGAGTDPSEGAALGVAILRHLKRRGALVLATTHLNDLKLFAEAEARVCNASVEFDEETLAPTYHLRIGLPGSSNAFAIARRLGVPREVLADGRAMLSSESKRLEQVIAEMDRARRKLDHERAELERTRAASDTEAERARREAEALKEARRRGIEEGFEEARAIVREAREQTRQILDELRRQPREGKATQQLLDKLKALEQRIEEEAEEFRPPADAAQPVDIRPGDAVLIRSIGKRGVALSAPDVAGRVEVSMGGVKMEVRARDLERADDAALLESRDTVGALRIEKAFTAKPQLNIRGLTVEEALPLLDKFLDDASLAQLEEVRIIHGKGTGVLREAVRDFLRNHALVKGFRFADPHDGGIGVTVAEL